MKTNTKNNQPDLFHRPFHLHLEYFFRNQYVLLAVLGLLLVAVLRSDGKVINMLRESYAQGFGIVGQYMREETGRTPVTFDIGVRSAAYSGK